MTVPTLSRVVRLLRVYSKVGNELLEEYPLEHTTLDDLQRAFGVEPDDPMYDCYRVTAREVRFINGRVAHDVQLDRYDYFVECDAT